MSGFSALVQAATAQLNELVEEEERRKSKTYVSDTERAVSISHHEDSHSAVGAVSDASRAREKPSPCTSPKTPSIEGSELLMDLSTTPPLVNDNRALSFPEALMRLALDPSNEDTIAFLPDGCYFCVRSTSFAQTLLPRHLFDYCESFEEFLALLHGWGFSRILRQEQDEARFIHSRRNSEEFSIASRRSLGNRSNSASSVMRRPSNMASDRSYSGSSVMRRLSDRASTPCTVEVFRHPKFVKGDWKTCREIRFGESPTNARLSALAPRATHPDASTKRRLSPGCSGQRDSDLMSVASHSLHHDNLRSNKRLSLDASVATGGEESCFSTTRSAEIRSVASALASEKLNLGCEVTSETGAAQGCCCTSSLAPSSFDSISSSCQPLIDQAVKSATHTIVTDAIESLLNDETHTKETYLKHSKELSRSYIPGVVPISKQLFDRQPPLSSS